MEQRSKDIPAFYQPVTSAKLDINNKSISISSLFCGVGARLRISRANSYKRLTYLVKLKKNH